MNCYKNIIILKQYEVVNMKIPFGPREPNKKETKLLTKLGFDTNKMEKKGRYYYIEVPSDSNIKCKANDSAFDRTETTITYKGVEVISINQKTAIYDSYCYFNISEQAVEEALAKQEVEEKSENEAVKLTKFQKKLADRLSQVEFIVFGEGAQLGYGKMLGAQFPYLQALKKENPAEHDQLINSNEKYKKLLEMFPNWTDAFNLQGRYQDQDVGPFLAFGRID